jgi:hypothetical protein
MGIDKVLDGSELSNPSTLEEEVFTLAPAPLLADDEDCIEVEPDLTGRDTHTEPDVVVQPIAERDTNG